MKSLVFLILAGYAVRCDDSSNYYVIQMPDEETPLREVRKPFRVYWNVPTMQCKSKKVLFEDLYGRYGIIQNKNDSFRGEKISILYDPGLFPALLEDESGNLRFRNGGVPQQGDLDKHIEYFRTVMDESIQDENFDGVGIIDFESWRPVLRQNFGTLTPYKDVSYEAERKEHWWWPKPWIVEEAKRKFEAAATSFMQTTLEVAKQMRPKALWGYYGFPHCFNMAAKSMLERCADGVDRENDQISWLWSDSSALFPSVYPRKGLTTENIRAMIRGRVREASRVRQKSSPLLPYATYRRGDDVFVTKEDFEATIETIYNSPASGMVIWGSSNDVNTLDKCKKLQKYVETILGPIVAKYTKQNNVLLDEIPVEFNTDFVNLTTASPITQENVTTVQPIIVTTAKPVATTLIEQVNITDYLNQTVLDNETVIDIILDTINEIKSEESNGSVSTTIPTTSVSYLEADKYTEAPVMATSTFNLDEEKDENVAITQNSFTNPYTYITTRIPYNESDEVTASTTEDRITDATTENTPTTSDSTTVNLLSTMDGTTTNLPTTDSTPTTTDSSTVNAPTTETTTEYYSHRNIFFNQDTLYSPNKDNLTNMEAENDLLTEIWLDLNETDILTEIFETATEEEYEDRFSVESSTSSTTESLDMISKDEWRSYPEVVEVLQDSTSSSAASNEVTTSSTVVTNKHSLCILFYFYSVSKCLCDVYGQCSR